MLRCCNVIASEAKQSRVKEKGWIASSLALLAMTALMVGYATKRRNAA